MHLKISLLAFFVASPAFSQGLTLRMTVTDSTGKTSPQILQTDRTRARLDLPNGAKLVYNSETKKLNVLFPGATVYAELTPQLIQLLGATSGRGQPAPAPIAITYKRTGSARVGQWPCTTYEGFRGTEKVFEVCAAEGRAITLSASDFVVVQQALDTVKGAVPQDILDGIPVYGTEAQGFAGFPVRRTTFVNGKADSTVELVEFNRDAIPNANFATPTGVPNSNPVR